LNKSTAGVLRNRHKKDHRENYDYNILIWSAAFKQ